MIVATPKQLPAKVADKAARAALVRAAEILDDEGWTRGGKADDVARRTGPLSVTGALGVAARQLGPYHHSDEVYDAARARLLAHLGWDGLLIDWNDHPHRTKGQVTAALRGAAR